MNPAPPVTRTFTEMPPSRNRHYGRSRPLEHLFVGADPIPQASNAGLFVDLRLPFELAGRFSDIADVTLLVAGPPIAERHVHVLAPQALEHRPAFVPHGERILRTSTNVVNLASGSLDLLRSQTQGAHQVFDKQHIAHLFAITVNRQRFSGYGGN